MPPRALIVCVVTSLMIVASAVAAAPTPVEDPVGPPTKERFIVGFHKLPNDRSHYGGDRVVSVNDAIRFMVVETSDRSRIEERARTDDNVRYVSSDELRGDVLLFTPNDALYSNSGHYGSKKIGAEAAWDRTLGSTAAKSAHIDTGLNKGHEEFAGQNRVLQGYDFYNNDNEPEDEKGGALFGCNFHGTHTTGTATATINNGVGIAGLAQSSVLPIKALGGSSCQTSESILASSITYAADQGAHVATNSWRWPYDAPALLDAIDYAHAAGLTIVAAAGNNGPCTDCVERPWKLRADKVIIVASTDSNDAQSSFSSEGSEVDVAAPGTSIISSTGDTSGYSTYSGTSMAAPHVAGTVALLKALNPTWGYTEFDTRLKETAVDLGATGFDVKFGYGRINADAATSDGTAPPPQCSDGIDNDGDGLVDYPDDPGCTDLSDNDETDPVVSDTMHVHDIQHSRKGSPRSGDLNIAIAVADGNEAGVASVSICVEVTKQDGPTASGCGTTASDGTITFTWAGVGSGTYTTCVTSLTKSGYAWDQAADHASSGSCHTSSV